MTYFTTRSNCNIGFSVGKSEESGLGRVRRSLFLWKISIVTETMAKNLRSQTAKKSVEEVCYRIFVNVSLFVLQAKDSGCVSHPTSLINDSKPVKTLSHFPRQYREPLSYIFGKDLGFHEQS